MFQFKAISIALLLACSQLAAAGTVHLNRNHDSIALKHRTNAARMAEGLPPLPPRELRARTYGPHNPHTPPKTPTQPNHPRPSPNKPDCDDKKQVKIKCTKKNGGGTVGYVSRDFSKKGKKGLGLCTDSKSAFKVDFENSITPFDFKGTSSNPFPYLGFSGNNLRPGTSDSAVLTTTHKTGRGVGPSNVGNAFTNWSPHSESQIWAYTRSDKKVTPTWVNSGGSSVASPKICYNPDEDVFHLVADVTQFVKENRRAYEVEFSIED